MDYAKHSHRKTQLPCPLSKAGAVTDSPPKIPPHLESVGHTEAAALLTARSATRSATHSATVAPPRLSLPFLAFIPLDVVVQGRRLTARHGNTILIAHHRAADAALVHHEERTVVHDVVEAVEVVAASTAALAAAIATATPRGCGQRQQLDPFSGDSRESQLHAPARYRAPQLHRKVFADEARVTTHHARVGPHEEHHARLPGCRKRSRGDGQRRFTGEPRPEVKCGEHVAAKLVQEGDDGHHRQQAQGAQAPHHGARPAPPLLPRTQKPPKEGHCWLTGH